jgi:hypothetical protein
MIGPQQIGRNMKTALTLIALSFVTGALQAEIVSKSYTIGRKTINIFYPDSNPSWKDQLHGAYCRNAIYQELKKNEELLVNVKEVECRLLEDSEVPHFKVTESYDVKTQRLLIPFNFVEGKRQYPLFNEIVEYVAAKRFLEEEVVPDEIESAKEVATEVKQEKEVLKEEISKDKEQLIDKKEEAQVKVEETSEETKEITKDEIQDFIAEFPSEFSDLVKGLPWIPKDEKLKESFKIFIKKIKTDPDAKGLSMGSLVGAMKFFEENKDGIQEKTYMKEAKRSGHSAKEYNWEGIKNKDQIVIVNYTLSRYQKRFFILDLEENKVRSTMAAQGYGSNTQGKYSKVPGRFSNIEGSGMTSRGFYLSAGTYCSSGKFFGSCRGDNSANAIYLDGLSKHNWRAKERAVVFHGATYVSASGGASGNSAGCPSIPIAKWTQFHQDLKRGTLFYHYTNNEYEEYKKSKVKQ